MTGNSSFFFSSLDSRETKVVNLPNLANGATALSLAAAAAAAETPTDAEDDEIIKVKGLLRP